MVNTSDNRLTVPSYGMPAQSPGGGGKRSKQCWLLHHLQIQYYIENFVGKTMKNP